MNDFNPLVSIIIPVYNGSNYLIEAIDSALAQTYQNVEILVINDGSKDEGATRNIALSYGDRIRYFEKKNEGVATALNLGIEKMHGEYFSWLSHDDRYLHGKIESQISFLSNLKNRDVVVYSDFIFINKDSEFLSKHQFVHYPPEKFRSAFIRDGIISGCTLLVPRICFESCGNFKTNLRTTQDYELWFRISEKYAFVHIPEALIQSRIHESQDTRKLKKIVIEEKDNLNLLFLTNISDDEIIRFSNGNPTGYYLTYARNMESSGCIQSQKLALKRAFRNLFRKSFRTAVVNILGFCRLIMFIRMRRILVGCFSEKTITKLKKLLNR